MEFPIEKQDKCKREMELAALIELRAYYLERWKTQKEFLWNSPPVHDRFFKTLVRASWCIYGGVSGGVITQKGHESGRFAVGLSVLREAGLLNEFLPTELGFKILEHFARAEAKFPEGYKFEDGTTYHWPAIEKQKGTMRGVRRHNK